MFDKNKKMYFLEANLCPGYKLFKPSDTLYIEWWNNVSDLIRKDDSSMWTMMKSKSKMTITKQVDNKYEYEDDARTSDFELLRSECCYPGSKPY